MKDTRKYFDNHDGVDVLFFTSDNLAFFDEQNALNHALQLEDGSVTTMTREEADTEVALLHKDWDKDTEYDPLDEPDAE